MKEGTLQALATSGEAPGELPALETIFLEHRTRVYRAAYRITGHAEDAEDVLQTVFLRLARRPPREVDNLPSYLYRSAVNAALDVLRDRKEKPGSPLEEAGGGAAAVAPERSAEAAELRERLRRALARLTPQAAEAFSLRYFEGLENQEIARLLGVSRVAVAVMLHRTRRRLQGELRAMTGGRT
jgi:RNA polymerase sigma-70 factor, ECF subfamily